MSPSHDSFRPLRPSPLEDAVAHLRRRGSSFIAFGALAGAATIAAVYLIAFFVVIVGGPRSLSASNRIAGATGSSSFCSDCSTSSPARGLILFGRPENSKFVLGIFLRHRSFVLRLELDRLWSLS